MKNNSRGPQTGKKHEQVKLILSLFGLNLIHPHGKLTKTELADDFKNIIKPSSVKKILPVPA